MAPSLFDVKVPARSLYGSVEQYATEKGPAVMSGTVVGVDGDRDRQVVMIDDPRLPYVVTGDIRRGRVVDMRFEARDGLAVGAADLRGLGIVSMLTTWADI